MSDSLSLNLGAIRTATLSSNGKLSTEKSVQGYAESRRQAIQEQSNDSSSNPEIRKLKRELADLQKELKVALQAGGGEEAQQKIQMIQAKIDQIKARIKELEKQEEAEKEQQHAQPKETPEEQAKADAKALGRLVDVSI